MARAILLAYAEEERLRNMKSRLKADFKSANPKMPSQRKVSSQQVMKLVEFMEKHVNTGIGLDSLTTNNKEHEKYWKEITTTLNRMPGEHKTPDAWKRYWVLTKCRTRNKRAEGKVLVKYEKRLLAVVDSQENYSRNKVKSGYTSALLNPKDEEEEYYEEERLELSIEDDVTEMDFVDTSELPALHDHEYASNNNRLTEDSNDNPASEIKIESIMTSHQEDDIPDWVRALENKRLALEERTATALEKVADGVTSIRDGISAISDSVTSMSGSMDRMGLAMVRLAGSMKLLEESFKKGQGSGS